MRKAHYEMQEEHTRLTASALGLKCFWMINKLLENPPPFGAVGNIQDIKSSRNLAVYILDYGSFDSSFSRCISSMSSRASSSVIVWLELSSHGSGR